MIRGVLVAGRRSLFSTGSLFRSLALLKSLLFLLSIAGHSSILAQDDADGDSTSIHLTLGVRGMIQTGSTARRSVAPKLQLVIESSKVRIDERVMYDHMWINGSVVNDDFWNSTLVQVARHHKFFPVVTINGGSALSFSIDRFLIIGGGLGTGFLRKNERHVLELHVYAGYLNMEFKHLEVSSSATAGGLVRAQFDILQGHSITWDAASYHDLGNKENWGLRNFISLKFRLSRVISLALNHETFFNNIFIPGVQELNTQTRGGVEFRL